MLSVVFISGHKRALLCIKHIFYYFILKCVGVATHTMNRSLLTHQALNAHFHFIYSTNSVDYLIAL